MKLERISALAVKDLFRGSRSLILTYGVAIPLGASLIITLLLGSLFQGRPRLGVVDLGESNLPVQLARLEYLETRSYADPVALRRDVERGALDMGIVLPDGLDESLAAGRTSALDVLVWGESLVRDRAKLSAALSRELMVVAGRDSPVEVATVLLGQGRVTTWAERLFPLVVIMTIVLGGTMVPATSLVYEKQTGTLVALTVTPTTYGEVLVAKGLVSALVTTVMGIVILAINGAFGAQPALMVLLMALGALFASQIGLLLGALVGDITSLFAVIKGLGIFLYAPAILYMFPELPAWISRLFPTYYVLGPIVEVSMADAGWADIRGEVAVLCVLIAAAGIVVGLVARRESERV